MKLYTIGFTQKPAEQFFGLLQASGARSLVDVRLNNVSQLAGFAKRDDLAYFLRVVCGMTYCHLPLLAPTQSLLDGYRKQRGGWDAYAAAFLALLAERQIERSLQPGDLSDSVLLCSEHEPARCHRRLVAEYLAARWENVEIVHLL